MREVEIGRKMCACVCVSINVILHRPSTWPPPTPLTNRQFMIMYIHFARWFNHFCCQRFHTHIEHCSFVRSMNKIIEKTGEWMLFDPTFHYCCCLSCIRRYVASIVTHATTLVLLFMCWWRWTTLCVLRRWFGCLCVCIIFAIEHFQFQAAATAIRQWLFDVQHSQIFLLLFLFVPR